MNGMSKKPARTLTIGPQGEITLPEDVLQMLDVAPGEKVEFRIDTRHKSVRIERHVDDAWAEAMQPKEQAGFEDILDEQTKRERDAERLFDKRVEEADPEDKKRRPEDDPNLWR